MTDSESWHIVSRIIDWQTGEVLADVGQVVTLGDGSRLADVIQDCRAASLMQYGPAAFVWAGEMLTEIGKCSRYSS